MLEQIDASFEQVGIVDIFDKCRNVFINEYKDSKSTTVKLCGITLKDQETVDLLQKRLNFYFASYDVKLYHHLSTDGKFGGLVIRVRNFLLSDPDLLKVNENIVIH